MRRRAVVLASTAVALVLTGCPKRTAIWVVRGSTADRLEFGIADRRDGARAVQIDVLRVSSCDSAPYGPTGAAWLLSRVTEATPPPTRVTYGREPLGFRSDQGPQPLVPGCYDAMVTGTGRLRFEIETQGAVTEFRR